MIMADVLKYFLIIVGSMIVFVSYWLAVVALFPALVVRTQAQFDRPFKLLGAGLATVIPLIGLVIYLFKRANPALTLTGSILLGTVIATGLVGVSGLSRRIGQGLPSPLDEAQPWRRVYRGGVVLVLVYLLPFVGWFLILPVTLIMGFAAALLSMAGETAAPAAAKVPAPVMTSPAAS